MIGYDAYKKIKGTKVHAVVTPESLPIAVAIGPGDEHEGRKLIPLMESIHVRQESSTGRPRKKPKILYADSKYAMHLNRMYLRKKHIKYQIPTNEKKRKPGRPRRFDKQAYNRIRSMIERSFGWVKACRRVAVRYDRLSSVYMGFIHLACITLYLRILQ